MRTPFRRAIAAVTLIAGAAAQAQNIITLGAIVPSSGPFAEWGRANTATLQMLEKQVNEAGGVNGAKLKIVILDDDAKPAQAANDLRKLAGDDQVAGGGGPADQQRVRSDFSGRQRNEDRIDLAGVLQARRRQGQPAVGVPQHR